MPRKEEELLKNELIKFQAPLDFDNIKESGFYTPTKSGIAFIDYTVSVTDSGFLVQVQDITDRKKAEKELYYHAKLVDNIFDAVISTDMNFNIISWK